MKTLLENEQKELLAIKAEEGIQLNILKNDTDLPQLCEKAKNLNQQTNQIQEEIEDKKNQLLKTKVKNFLIFFFLLFL